MTQVEARRQRDDAGLIAKASFDFGKDCRLAYASRADQSDRASCRAGGRSQGSENVVAFDQAGRFRRDCPDACAGHGEQADLLVEAFQRSRTKIFCVEGSDTRQQVECRLAHDEAARWREALNTRRDIEVEPGHLRPPVVARRMRQYCATVHSDSHLQRCQRIGHLLEYLQHRRDPRQCGILAVGVEAETSEDAVALQLEDLAIEGGDHLGADAMIALQQCVIGFQISSRRRCGRADEVDEREG